MRMEPVRYKAVLFDLLTALLDSWSLWNDIAGDEAAGRAWQAEYLRMTYRTGAYRPYEDLVAESAESVGLPRSLGHELDERFGELAPWPEVKEVLQQLSGAGVRLGIVTNCSERLGRIAAARTGVDWDVMVTAERAGFYKPDARTYRLAMQELGAGMEDCLFVAGSAYDLSVTKNVGLPVYWHDRIGMAVPDGMPAPLVRESSLRPLVPMVIADSL